MAKRFTDTDKWRDPWFVGLPLIDKLFWLFVLDRCNHGGIWLECWHDVDYFLGTRPNLANFDGRLIRVAEGKIFIPKFLTFQYGTDWLHSRVKASNNALKILKDEGLFDFAKKHTRKHKIKEAYSPLEAPPKPLQSPSKAPPKEATTTATATENDNGNGSQQTTTVTATAVHARPR